MHVWFKVKLGLCTAKSKAHCIGALTRGFHVRGSPRRISPKLRPLIFNPFSFISSLTFLSLSPSFTTAMSKKVTPTKPMNISSPRQRPTDPTGSPSVSGSPSARMLRAQYTGTPPLPNIPTRSSQTPIGTPRGLGLPESMTTGEGPSRRVSVAGIAARRPGTPGSGSEVNLLDDLTDEEKARVLRKHLVSRDGRQQDSPRGSISALPDNGLLSKRSSSSQLRIQREDTEPFPVPYHAPGADVT